MAATPQNRLRDQIRLYIFPLANNAARNAGVTVVIIGIGSPKGDPFLYEGNGSSTEKRKVAHINAYLVPFDDIFIEANTRPMSKLSAMVNGNKPVDGGHLIFSPTEAAAMIERDGRAARFIRPFVGAAEAINGNYRRCLWIRTNQSSDALGVVDIRERIERVREFRKSSTKPLTREGAATPFAFQQVRQGDEEIALVIPQTSSESRPYLPIALGPRKAIMSNAVLGLLDTPIWNMAVFASKLHLIWIAAVCGKLKTDYRYSNTLGWNTFPLPELTEQDKADLTRCAEDILLAREVHFPATIADLYDPEAMPENLLAAHDRNDEILERIYIGRRFKNDTERLETLFAMYTKMTEGGGTGTKGVGSKPRGRKKKEVQA